MSNITANTEDWRNSPEKKVWEELHEDAAHDCNIVIKIDCVGHVSKNFASKIEALVTDGKKMEDGKSINRRLNRLGQNFMIIYNHSFSLTHTH